MVRETSAMLNGLRESAPLKMTSAISPPRKALADCSPRTHRMASETLDLPQPFGPTMAVTPGWKFSAVLSAKDLKPKTVRFFRYIDTDKFVKPTQPNLVPQVKRKTQYVVHNRSCGATNGEEPWLALRQKPSLLPLTVPLFYTPEWGCGQMIFGATFGILRMTF